MGKVENVGEMYMCDVCGNVVEVKEAGGGDGPRGVSRGRGTMFNLSRRFDHAPNMDCGLTINKFPS